MKRTNVSPAIALILFTGLACTLVAAPTARRDAWLTKRLIGAWTCDTFGEQVLTNHSDGTATLDMTLSRLPALRYGRTLQLELEWTVEDGVLRHTVVGGSPPSKVARLTDDFGETMEYEIVELASTHMLLAETDEEDEEQRWEAVPQVASRE